MILDNALFSWYNKSTKGKEITPMNIIDQLTAYFDSKLKLLPQIETLEDREYVMDKARGALEFAVEISEWKIKKTLANLWVEYYTKFREAVYRK